MNIRELLIRIGVTGTDSTTREVNRVDNAISDLKSSASNLGSILGAAFAGASLLSIIHAADEMQTLEFRVKQTAQTNEDAAASFDSIAQHASESRISIEHYVEAYASIGAATHDLIHDQEDLIAVTDTVAKGLQVAGANAQQTSSVMAQLTQAVAVGKLQWEDLKVVMQNSDAFAVRLAKSLGMSLSEMVNATQGQGGGIGADKIIDALRNMHDEVEETFSQLPMTVTNALTVVQNRFNMMVHRANRASSAITLVANAIVQAFNYIEAGTEGMIDALGGAENAVKLLGVALGAAGLVASVALARMAFATLFSPIGLLIAGLTALFLVGEDVYKWLKGGPSLLGDMIGPVSNYRKEVDGLTQGLTDLWGIGVKVYDILKSVTEILNHSSDWTASIGSYLGTDKIGPWLQDQAKWVGGDLMKWAKWGNAQTYGAFDVPQMWGDAMRGANESRQDNQLNYQRQVSFRENYDPSVMLSSPSAGARTNTVNVTIGNIDATNSQDAPADIRRAATEGVNQALNAPAGFRPLGDSLNFAGGGN